MSSTDAFIAAAKAVLAGYSAVEHCVSYDDLEHEYFVRISDEKLQYYKRFPAEWFDGCEALVGHNIGEFLVKLHKAIKNTED